VLVVVFGNYQPKDRQKCDSSDRLFLFHSAAHYTVYCDPDKLASHPVAFFRVVVISARPCFARLRYLVKGERAVQLIHFQFLLWITTFPVIFFVLTPALFMLIKIFFGRPGDIVLAILAITAVGVSGTVAGLIATWQNRIVGPRPKRLLICTTVWSLLLLALALPWD
jgi:hypothetical protein